MKYALLLLIFAVNVHAAPCVRKLLASGDRSQDTAEFMLYLEELVKERVISIESLNPFFEKIEHNELVNPITNKNSSKNLVIHFDGFEELIKSDSIDVTKVREWAIGFKSQESVTQIQKQTIKTVTVSVPAYVSSSGAMFYRVAHPLLGDAYKILKPNGKFDHPEDWEKIVWALGALKDQDGNFVKKNMGDGRKNRNIQWNIGDEEAELACRELGVNYGLATHDDYKNLIRYFDHSNDYQGFPKLIQAGRDEFKKLFPTPSSGHFWTSSTFIEDERGAWVFTDFGSLDKANRENLYWVKCIERR